MPPIKIQPIDIDSRKVREAVVRNDSARPGSRSRLWNWRLLFSDRQSTVAAGESSSNRDGGGSELEPSSTSLERMVQNFIEDQPPAANRGRNCCNCFNNNDSSDDESISDAGEELKSLIPCSSDTERNLLADATKIVERNKKISRTKDDLRNIVADGLSSLGYGSSICICKWNKTSSYPAGEHEFIEVIIEGERFIVDIDFRSEFEIARSTERYKAMLQSLPYIFVGKSERLDQIVLIMSEAAKQSLKKKGMPIPPWRKAEYMRAKWLSAYNTTKRNGDVQLEKKAEPAPTWQPPALKPKPVDKGPKVVTGLAALFRSSKH